ncbi:MAG: TspO/MBR family protein [Rariglobus sp.]|nr:TspO/MBR family protein [Rariglobus sp.]
MPSPRSWPALLGFILLVAIVSAAGGAITATSVTTWYASLDKPAWTPPGWLFGPAWTLLYAMMAVVAWRLWQQRHESPGARLTLRLWFLQLALNCAWSFLFFGLRSPLAGLLDILALLVVIIWIQLCLVREHRTLALLWTPYIAWVAFATALNASIWLRN